VQTRLSPTDIERLVKRYRTGTPINDLAAEFEINRTTVMKHIERTGAPRRRGVVLDHLDEARRLYEQGWSLARLGRHLGVDPGTVWYTFKNAGVPTRPRSGSANH
jgi:transposase-like protein